jgi:hypothetical protein
MPAFTNAIYYLENLKLVDSTTVNNCFTLVNYSYYLTNLHTVEFLIKLEDVCTIVLEEDRKICKLITFAEYC